MKDNLFIEIGKRIRAVRKIQKLSQEEFAHLLMVHRGHISKIETGMVPPSLGLIALISVNFDTNLIWLISGVGEMKHPYPLKMFKNMDFFSKISPEMSPEFKGLVAILEMYDDMVKRHNHIFMCIDDQDIFRLGESGVKPGDPIVVEVLWNILSKKLDKSLFFTLVDGKIPNKVERAVLNILKHLDESDLRDIYALLFSKVKRIKGEDEKGILKEEIKILRNAVK